MKLEKAKIIVPAQGNRSIPVMYNPTEYAVATTAEISGEGSNVRFTKVTPQDLTVSLFFDTYEAGTDVRVKTEEIHSLIIPSQEGRETKTLPICLFNWGTFTYRGIIQKVEQKFTMFLGSGVPVRAQLTVTFKAYNSPETEIKFAGKDNCRKFWVIKESDRLDLIAAETLQDPSLWREIAKTNKELISNPNTFPAANAIGKMLIIPDLHN